MMAFEDFTKEHMDRLAIRLGEDYRIHVTDTLKNNSVVQPQLVFQRKGSPVCPAVYLQDQYDLYMEQPDEERMNGVIENILLLYEQHEKEMAEVSKMPQKLVHYEDVKDNILFKLINTEYNQELLMQVPHIPYLDLSIVFYIYVSESEQGIMATLVHNEHIESWNVTVDELYEAARKNTPERMPARFCSIVELLFGLGEDLEENPTIEGEIVQSQPCNGVPHLCVLTNTAGINGAAALLYPGTLKKCSKVLNKDLYILPSSTHEVLLLPHEKKIEAEELAYMIQSINSENVPREEWLSDHAYFYRREDDKVTAV